MDSQITICDKHSDYHVPLISTMAFSGAEQWCPFCGATESMFGGEQVPLTKYLETRLARYKKFSKAFIKATATFSASRVMYKGEYLTLGELPADYVDSQKAIARNWKYGVHIEDVELADTITINELLKSHFMGKTIRVLGKELLVDRVVVPFMEDAQVYFYGTGGDDTDCIRVKFDQDIEVVQE